MIPKEITPSFFQKKLLLQAAQIRGLEPTEVPGVKKVNSDQTESSFTLNANMVKTMGYYSG